MVSSGIQRLFYVVWMIIKLNLYFVLFTLIGGVLFGAGPAFQTMTDLLMEHGIDYQQVTFKGFMSQWRKNFKRSNVHFLLFAGISFFLGYNLYLSAQIQGLLWLVIDFVLVFVLLLLTVFYLYVTQYETKYEITHFNLFKLAFVSVFLNFSAFLKVLFGLISILVLTWFFKGLLLFATFALIAVWSGFATKDNRFMVARKLAQHG